jgi:hypothetical protein
MQKPRLGDARCKVNAYCLDNDLADEISPGFSIPILRREACLEDDINCSTNVHLVCLSVDRHADVLLLSMEQHGERGGPCSCIGWTKLPRRDAVVCTMLCEKGRKIEIKERTKICGECSSLDGAEDRRKDARKLEKELFVVARDPCPPWVYVCTKGEGYKVIEFSIEGWIGRGCLEKRWWGRGRWEVREKKTLC